MGLARVETLRFLEIAQGLVVSTDSKLVGLPLLEVAPVGQSRYNSKQFLVIDGPGLLRGRQFFEEVTYRVFKTLVDLQENSTHCNRRRFPHHNKGLSNISVPEDRRREKYLLNLVKG